MKIVYTSLLDRIRELDTFKYIKIYNNQVDRIRFGIEAFVNPSCFIEIQTSNVTNIGQMLNGVDLDIRVHLVHQEYDAGNGRLDENLNVYTVANLIKKTLVQFAPSQCGPISSSPEVMQFKHDNLYHYVLKFKCHWIDSSSYVDYDIEPFYIIWQDADIIWTKANQTWEHFIGPVLGLNLPQV